MLTFLLSDPICIISIVTVNEDDNDGGDCDHFDITMMTKMILILIMKMLLMLSKI